MARLDYSALQDRAADAGSLLGHKIFQEAVASLRESILTRLLLLPVGDPKVVELHAKAKLIDEVVAELRSFVTDLKMAKKSEDL